MRRLVIGGLLAASVLTTWSDGAAAGLAVGGVSVAATDLIVSMSHDAAVVTTTGFSGIGYTSGQVNTLIDPDPTAGYIRVTTGGDQLVWSTRSALVVADTDDQWDVYVRPRTAGTWALVTGQLAAGDYLATSVSMNSRWLTVRRLSSGLPVELLALDTWTSTSTVISFGTVFPSNASMTPDGRYIVFAAVDSANPGGLAHVYRWDSTTATRTVIDVNAGGTVANGGARQPAVSDDGEWVAFASAATNLVPTVSAPLFANAHLFTYELRTGAITLVDTNVAGVSQDNYGQSGDDWIDGSGTRITYVKNDQIWVWDRSTATTEQISASGGIVAPGWPQLRSDGRAVFWRQFGATTGDYDTLTRNLSQPIDPPPDRPGLVPVPPRRLVDTRPTGNTVDGEFARGGLVAPARTLRVRLAGRGGLDSASSAVAVNVTVTNASGNGYLTMWPCDTVSPPNASNLNFGAGRDVPNLVIAPVDPSGFACLQLAESSGHVVIDGSAAFQTGSGYIATSPTRVFDTRSGGQTIDGKAQGEGMVVPGSNRIVRLDGRGLPRTDIGAVVLNVTVTGAEGPGYLTVWPCTGPEPPNASNLNFIPGRDVANVVIVKVAVNSTLCFRTFGASAHVIADLNGRLPNGGDFSSTNPQRLLDSRVGGTTIDQTFAGIGAAAPGRTVEVKIAGRGGVPSNARAVALNVTVTQPSASGFLTVWPCDTASPPDASNLNFQAGQDVPNQVVTALSASGTVCLQSALASTHVIADLQGWFAPPVAP